CRCRGGILGREAISRGTSDLIASNGLAHGYTMWRFENGDQAFQQYPDSVQSVVNPDLMVEGEGFVARDLKFLENLRDAIVQNAAKRGRPRPTASHPSHHLPDRGFGTP